MSSVIDCPCGHGTRAGRPSGMCERCEDEFFARLPSKPAEQALIEFHARKAGAIGIFYRCTEKIPADLKTWDEIHLCLSEHGYEHIGRIYRNGVRVFSAPRPAMKGSVGL